MKQINGLWYVANPDNPDAVRALAKYDPSAAGTFIIGMLCFGAGLINLFTAIDAGAGFWAVVSFLMVAAGIYFCATDISKDTNFKRHLKARQILALDERLMGQLELVLVEEGLDLTYPEIEAEMPGMYHAFHAATNPPDGGETIRQKLARQRALLRVEARRIKLERQARQELQQGALPTDPRASLVDVQAELQRFQSGDPEPA